jgi:hypothetical protein
MKIALGTLARSGIEARFGAEAKAGIDAALRHYTRRLKSGNQPVAVPSFGRDARCQDAPHAFDIALAPEVETTLGSEARRQGVTIDLLAGHAVLVYLADLDASAGDSSGERAKEETDLLRYQPRCVSTATRPLLAARRHVDSA